MKFSIIVPTYNREKYIIKCIDSVLDQTYDNFEVIIIDDGSTDNTENLVKKYQDKRIKYFKNENHGIGYSRNFGINKAKGDYIFFLDSDDYLEENMLEEVLNNIKNHDILIFNYKEIYEVDNHILLNGFDEFSDYTLEKHPELINKINLGPCNKVFSTKLFKDKENRFPEDIKYEDFPLIIKLFKEAKKIKSCGLYLTNVAVHKGGETLTVDERVFDIFKGLDMVKNTLNDKVYKNELNKLIVKKVTTYTISQRTQKDKSLINKFIDEAFNYLKKNVKDYKNNKYYKNRSFMKRSIEKNKFLTKTYCKIYKLIK